MGKDVQACYFFRGLKLRQTTAPPKFNIMGGGGVITSLLPPPHWTSLLTSLTFIFTAYKDVLR